MKAEIYVKFSLFPFHVKTESTISSLFLTSETDKRFLNEDLSKQEKKSDSEILIGQFEKLKPFTKPLVIISALI